MTTGFQCDNCRKFAPAPAHGWLHVLQQGAPGMLAALPGTGTDVLWTFCTVLCLAQYTMAAALGDGKMAGEEP